MRSISCLVMGVVLCQGAAYAEPELGLFDLLRCVHGYTDGHTAYLPLAGVAEWVGATVSTQGPDVYLSADGIRLKLTVGSGVCFTDTGLPVVVFAPVKVIGRTLCVPARFWEKLGWTVDYVTGQYVFDQTAPNVADKMAGNPVIVLSRGARAASVLLHSAPPDVVAKFIGDFENSDAGIMYGEDRQSCWLGRYGIDWITRVNDITQDHFRGVLPATLDDRVLGDGVLSFWTNAACVYGVRAGRWRILLATQWGYTRKDWLAAGIPVSVAQAWHETLH